MTTSDLIYFNVVLPALIVGIACAGVLWHERYLRRCRSLDDLVERDLPRAALTIRGTPIDDYEAAGVVSSEGMEAALNVFPLLDRVRLRAAVAYAREFPKPDSRIAVDAKPSTSEPPRESMTIADRIAELQRTLEALIAGASGWPPGLIDGAVKRLETAIEALGMTDDELREISALYQAPPQLGAGPTSQALMIELARRTTLSPHQRMAEAAERARLGSA